MSAARMRSTLAPSFSGVVSRSLARWESGAFRCRMLRPLGLWLDSSWKLPPGAAPSTSATSFSSSAERAASNSFHDQV